MVKFHTCLINLCGKYKWENFIKSLVPRHIMLAAVYAVDSRLCYFDGVDL